MNINKPIFIIGSGRSGTTVFYNYLSTHPDLCWFSNLSDKYYTVFGIPLIHRVLDFPFVEQILQNKIINRGRFGIKPTEAKNIYHKYCGFDETKKLDETDYDDQLGDRFKQVIQNHLKFTGKKHFLTKQTANTQRLRLINKIFPNAYYIHLIRDGRAVANSLYNVDWWDEMEVWWKGGMKAKEWDGDKIELCGLHWKNNVSEILENKDLFDGRYIEINYEDFGDNFRAIMSEVVAFCNLSKEENFLERMPKSLPITNHKWKNNLTKRQQGILNKTLEQPLQNLGYL